MAEGKLRVQRSTFNGSGGSGWSALSPFAGAVGTEGGECVFGGQCMRFSQFQAQAQEGHR
jgi:hypothetical protein